MANGGKRGAGAEEMRRVLTLPLVRACFRARDHGRACLDGVVMEMELGVSSSVLGTLKYFISVTGPFRVTSPLIS